MVGTPHDVSLARVLRYTNRRDEARAILLELREARVVAPSQPPYSHTTGSHSQGCRSAGYAYCRSTL
jgi:hypothetical protein